MEYCEKIDEKNIEKRIFSTFASVAEGLGYSPLHGQIIAALFVEQKPISLQELSKKIGYSASMVSLSLDLLEYLGAIKKIKRAGDRNLYLELKGNLLDTLKSAMMVKIKKGVTDSLLEFNSYKEHSKKFSKSDNDKTMKTINTLEKEVKRLQQYVELLEEIKLP